MVLYITWERLSPARIEELGEELEVLRNQWVALKDRITNAYKRVVGDYLITIDCWKYDESLLKEAMEALSKEIPIIDRIFEFDWLVEEHINNYLAVYLQSDGNLETAHFSYQWFHGQALVNALIKNLGFELKEDYDGITVIRTKIERPITHEKMCEALKKIYYGMQLYHIIKRAQESVAINTALLFVSTVQK